MYIYIYIHIHIYVYTYTPRCRGAGGCGRRASNWSARWTCLGAKARAYMKITSNTKEFMNSMKSVKKHTK